MLYANQLLEKYGLNLPDESGNITITDLEREETNLTGLSLTEEENQQLQTSYWDEFNPDSLTDLQLGVSYRELQTLEENKFKSVKEHLVIQSQLPYSLDILIPLNTDVLKRNISKVNMINLKNRQGDVETFTKEQLGDFDLNDSPVMMEYGWASMPNKRRTQVKRFNLEGWHILNKIDVLRNIITILGQETENETLRKDFIIVSRSLAEAIKAAYPLDFMEIPSNITASDEEIYFTLKSDAINQEGILPPAISCCQLMKTALALQ